MKVGVCLSTHWRAAERTNGSAGGRSKKSVFSAADLSVSLRRAGKFDFFIMLGKNIQVADRLNFCNLFFSRREMFSLTGGKYTNQQQQRMFCKIRFWIQNIYKTLQFANRIFSPTNQILGNVSKSAFSLFRNSHETVPSYTSCP